MTIKELELLRIDESPLNLDPANRLVNWDFSSGILDNKPKEDNDYFIRIGRAKYYNFEEAQALLNNLEKHIKW